MTLGMFSPQQLDKIVQDTIGKEDIPSDHKTAVVATFDSNGAKVAVVFHKDSSIGEWQFVGAVQHTWEGDNSAAGKVIFSR